MLRPSRIICHAHDHINIEHCGSYDGSLHWLKLLQPFIVSEVRRTTLDLFGESWTWNIGVKLLSLDAACYMNLEKKAWAGFDYQVCSGYTSCTSHRWGQSSVQPKQTSTWHQKPSRLNKCALAWTKNLDVFWCNLWSGWIVSKRRTPPYERIRQNQHRHLHHRSQSLTISYNQQQQPPLFYYHTQKTTCPDQLSTKR